MPVIIFYEKPGCINNGKQKHILLAAGYDLVERNILNEAWDPEELRKYFGNLPVEQWFNNSAPAVKNEEIIAGNLSETEAILLMINDPILIRRPLMRLGQTYRAGFDVNILDELIEITERTRYLDVALSDNNCPGLIH